MELNPWIVPSLSKITRDTFDTFVIFSDAAVTDPRAVGKFIISMCSRVSDILTILVLMKLVGMLETDGKKITKCPFDVTGLFETVGDLKTAPGIVFDLLSIPLLRQYVCEHRGGKLTVMMGYSGLYSLRVGFWRGKTNQLLIFPQILLETVHHWHQTLR
jgi:phosphoenolpyruvate carboxylase